MVRRFTTSVTAPKQTTLYRLVQRHAATFFADLEAAAGALPKIITRTYCDRATKPARRRSARLGGYRAVMLWFQ